LVTVRLNDLGHSALPGRIVPCWSGNVHRPAKGAGLEPIRIERFQSVHQQGRVTLTAELSGRPTSRWCRLCIANLDRYHEAFGEQPELIDATFVVATTTEGLATSQMALEAVVSATNERCFDAVGGQLS
jgi:hypothetical protein